MKNEAAYLNWKALERERGPGGLSTISFVRNGIHGTPEKDRKGPRFHRHGAVHLFYRAEAALRPIFNAIDIGELRAFTSTVTCSETLVAPCRQGNHELVSKFEAFLTGTPGLIILPFDLALARETAEIRASHGIRTPDAIQWATAIRCDASFFLTNDKGFKKFSKPEVVLMDDFLS